MLVKYLFVVVVILGFLIGCPKKNNVEQASTELILGTNGGYPPYENYNVKGELEGFDIDVAREVAKKLGKKLIIKDMSFDALILGLNQNKVDMVMAGMSITPTREKEITMVPYQGEPVKSYALIFWGTMPKNISSISDLAMTENKTVAVQTGTVMENYLQKYPQIAAKPLESMAELIMDLKYEKSIALLLEPHIADDVMPKFKELIRLDIPLSKEEWSYGNGIGIKKTNQSLSQQVNTAIVELRKTGALKKIEQKWFKDPAA